jgi:outer membrane protein assembly factor BamE (lipoprotein component of BamABCDE complex)
MDNLKKAAAGVATFIACVTLSGCAGPMITAAYQAAQGNLIRANLEREADAQASYHYGAKIDPAAVSQIKNGKTTREQVEAMFGPPQQVSLMGGGARMMYYTYYSASQNQTLQVELDGSNVVKDYEFIAPR